MRKTRSVWQKFNHEVLNSALSETPAGPLYHYTNQKGFLAIIKSGEIWASHHQCLNDTQEFLHAKGLVRDEIEKRRATEESDARLLLDVMCATLSEPGFEDVNLYVASFSQDGDSLPQWRSYGGFALGFWGDRLVVPDGFMLVRCIYESERQNEIANALVTEILDRTLPQTQTAGLPNAKLAAGTLLRINLHSFALMFKHERFKHEEEWRIVSWRPRMDFGPAYPVSETNQLPDFREGKSMLIPYFRVPLADRDGAFPIREVVVGPNPNINQSRRSVQSLLNSRSDLVKAKVRSSEVPYRDW